MLASEVHARVLEASGVVDVRIGATVDTFGGTPGEANARAFEVRGYPFGARKPA